MRDADLSSDLHPAEPPRPPPIGASPAQAPLSAGEARFPNGNTARWVRIPPEAEPDRIVRALGLSPPKAVLLLLGGAAEMAPMLSARIQQLFSRGLAVAAAESHALILDGGTQTGIMALMGQGVADRGRCSTLVGVAPAGRVALPEEEPSDSRSRLDPNHSHFVLVDSDVWGGETRILFRLAAALAVDVPILVVLINGGGVAKEEVLRAVRRGWPLVVLQGSDRLADEIATSLEARPPPTDPVLAEIVGDGNIHLFSVDSPAEVFARLVARNLSEDSVLKIAWQRFASYDANSAREQSSFRRLQFWTLVLGVVGTALALLKMHLVASGAMVPGKLPATLLQAAVVVAAASVTVLTAATSRFRAGSKWILLRTNAEAIKREIYRYRCHEAMRPQRPEVGDGQELAQQLQTIGHRQLADEPDGAALRAYEGPLPPPSSSAEGDDGFSPLTPASYIHIRLDDQLRFYQRRIDRGVRQFVTEQWIIIVIGGIGTVLAALRYELWVPLTTSMVMALTAHLGLQKVERRVTQYQQAVTDLENMKAWWSTLSTEQQGEPSNIDALVEGTERILQRENTGWEQEMKEALLRLDARHEREAREASAKKHPPP